MKTYRLIIPRWNAVIPPEWAVEIGLPEIVNDEPTGQFVFESASGRQILLGPGALLRAPGGDMKEVEVPVEGAEPQKIQISHGEELLERMLEHKFVEEVK